jgi:hypothetical protein
MQKQSVLASMITNEEAHILQLLKEKLGLKLFNEDARLYGEFMSAYSSVSGKLHHSGSLDAIKQADGIIILGSRVATDNPGVRYAMLQLHLLIMVRKLFMLTL